jgi:hypothetical protein
MDEDFCEQHCVRFSFWGFRLVPPFVPSRRATNRLSGGSAVLKQSLWFPGSPCPRSDALTCGLIAGQPPAPAAFFSTLSFFLFFFCVLPVLVCSSKKKTLLSQDSEAAESNS